MTNDEVTPVENTTEAALEFDATNVAEFTEAKIKVVNKVAMFKKEFDVEDDKTKEKKHITNFYIYVEINGRTLPTRANKYTIDALNQGFKTTIPSKWNGKMIVATLHEFNKNPYIVWKPKGSL